MRYALKKHPPRHSLTKAVLLQGNINVIIRQKQSFYHPKAMLLQDSIYLIKIKGYTTKRATPVMLLLYIISFRIE